MKVLETYQPAQLSESKIHAVVLKKQVELGITDKDKAGQLMGAVKKELGDSADGATIKKIIDSLF